MVIIQVVGMNKLLLLGGAFVVLLASCGQKGPLYLPQPAKPSPEASQSAPAKPAAEQDSARK